MEMKNFKEQVDKLCKEAFDATKELLKKSGEKNCIYFPECDDCFTVFVYFGSFIDDMEGMVGKGVKLDDSGDLQIRVGNTRGVDEWRPADNIYPLCYANMYDFVARNIDNAITEAETEALEKTEDDNEDSAAEDEDIEDEEIEKVEVEESNILFFNFNKGKKADRNAVEELFKEYYKEDNVVDVEKLASALGCDTDGVNYRDYRIGVEFFGYTFEGETEVTEDALRPILDAICKKYPSLKYEIA